MTSTEFLIGKREQIAWIEETSYGSGGTMSSGEVIGYNVKIDSPEWDQGWQEIMSAGSDTRAVEGYTLGPQSLPYNLNFTVVNWRWLKYLFNVADAGGPEYTHTCTIGNTVLSWKLEWAKRHTTSHVITAIGNVMRRATIRFQKANGPGQEGLINVSADCYAQSATAGSSVTSLSAPTATPFKYYHTKLTLDGSEFAEVNNGDITIDNGIDPKDSRYCNSTLARTVSDPIPKVHRVSGRFNLNITDSTIYDLWAAGDVVSGTTKLEFIRGASDKLILTFSNMRLNRGVAATNLDGVTNVTMVYTAESVAPVATDAISAY